MLQEELEARGPRGQLPHDTGIHPAHPLAPNRLDRSFEAAAPNQRWVADFTDVWATEGWLYIAVVLDLYSRLDVGWWMKSHMTADLVTDALVWPYGAETQVMN